MANIPHTILLVDDSESDRAICRRYLLANENYDYQILEAETLEEGLEQLKVGSPDAVLVDLNLPDGSGLELLEAIRKTYPGKNFPVIMMTSQGDERLAVQSMKLGASDYLFKDDMTASTLCHYVETAIAQWNLSGKLTELQQFNQELQALQTRLEESTQELQTSEAFNRSVLAAIPDLLLHLGRDGTCLNYIEPKVGKDRFQVIANHIAEFLPPDLLARQLQSIEQALATRELQVYEHQVLKNGQTAYEEIRISAIGERTVLAIVRDISDRKQMELNLQQSEKMNRIILETLPDLLIHMDLQGNYVRKSQGQNVRVLGLEDNSVELNIHNILPRHLVEQRLYFANLAIESGTLQICEQIIDFPEEQRFEEIRIAPLNEQEVLVIIRDVSDRKQAEAEIQQKNIELAELLQLREETLTMREDMSNMIVHDLRNPLSAMILGAGIVQRYINRADRMPFILKTLDKIQTSGQQINKMIDSLLLMAKLESGKIIFNPVPTDLYELGMDVIKDFELIANSCQIKLQSELPSVGNSVLIDPTILHRIIDNLLSNALKFSPPHSQITLSLEYLPENHLKIKVADMGLGISDPEKRKIFGKFEVGSLKKNTSQTGLGLAFCKMAVDAQGGTIRVVDNYPQGVIFIIEI
jgi:PAS domain S-box-containing protein